MDSVFNLKDKTLQVKHIDVAGVEIPTNDDEIRDTVDITQFLEAYKDPVGRIIADAKKYGQIVVSGKKTKQFLRNKALMSGVTGVRFYGLEITLFGDDPKSLTFVKLSAICMLAYYNKNKKSNIDNMTIPSLGSGLPKTLGNLNGLLCMAGPGAHFIVKYFHKEDTQGRDPKVGGMLAVCMMLDWSNYMRSHPESQLTFEDFITDESFDGIRNEFGGVVRNLGEDAIENLTAEQLEPLRTCTANAKKIERTGMSTVKVRKALGSIFGKIGS